MLSSAAMRAEIVRTPELDWTDHGEKGFGAQFLETRRVTARTRNRPMIGIRRIELQQLRQCRSSGLKHGGANGCLDTLQIQAAGISAITENDA
jgi:hypothetical protein